MYIYCFIQTDKWKQKNHNIQCRGFSVILSWRTGNWTTIFIKILKGLYGCAWKQLCHTNKNYNSYHTAVEFASQYMIKKDMRYIRFVIIRKITVEEFMDQNRKTDFSSMTIRSTGRVTLNIGGEPLFNRIFAPIELDWQLDIRLYYL